MKNQLNLVSCRSTLLLETKRDIYAISITSTNTAHQPYCRNSARSILFTEMDNFLQVNASESEVSSLVNADRDLWDIDTPCPVEACNGVTFWTYKSYMNHFHRCHMQYHFEFKCAVKTCRAVFDMKAKCRRHIQNVHGGKSAIITESIQSENFVDPKGKGPLRLGNVMERKFKQDRIKAAREQRQKLAAMCPPVNILTEVFNRDEEFFFKDGKPYKLIKGLKGKKPTVAPYERVSDFKVLCEMYNVQ